MSSDDTMFHESPRPFHSSSSNSSKSLRVSASPRACDRDEYNPYGCDLEKAQSMVSVDHYCCESSQLDIEQSLSLPPSISPQEDGHNNSDNNNNSKYDSKNNVNTDMDECVLSNESSRKHEQREREDEPGELPVILSPRTIPRPNTAENLVISVKPRGRSIVSEWLDLRGWWWGWSYRVQPVASNDDAESEREVSFGWSSRSASGSVSTRSIVVKPLKSNPSTLRTAVLSTSTTTAMHVIAESYSVGSDSEDGPDVESSVHMLKLPPADVFSDTSSVNENNNSNNNNINSKINKHRNSHSSSQSKSSDEDSTVRKKMIVELDDKAQNARNYHHRASMVDVWAFCVTTVIGGIFYGWNEALSAGVGSYVLAIFLVGFAFMVLICSLAEIISTVSFSGGAYGMARVVLGFYVGFLIAVFELMEYIAYTADSMRYVAEFICQKLHLGLYFVPLIVLPLYALAGAFVADGNYRYWRFTRLLALFSLVVLLIYCFGSLADVDFSENASMHANAANPHSRSNWFHGGMFSFVHILPFATWGFGGLESAALLVDMTDNPRVTLSRGMALGAGTLFACTIFITFVAVSLPPGVQELQKADYLMNFGFESVGFSESVGSWLIIPAQFAMAFGFVLPASKLLRAMSMSKLLPPIWGLQETDAPNAPVFYVLLMSYFLCVLSVFDRKLDITNVPILLAQITYISDLFAFYKLRTDFSNRESKFRSPFGIVGAALAAIIFALVALSGIAFHGNYGTALFVAVLAAGLTVYYFFYAKKKQHFSDDEQKSLLVLHVIKNNKKKRSSAQHHRSHHHHHHHHPHPHPHPQQHPLNSQTSANRL